MKLLSKTAKVLALVIVGLLCIGTIRVIIERKTDLLCGSLHIPR